MLRRCTMGVVLLSAVFWGVAARDADNFRRFLNAAAECNTRKGPLGFFNSRHIRRAQARPARFSLPKSASPMVQIRWAA